MSEPAGVIAELLEELTKLPGIGPKSAERIAHFLLAGDRRNAVLLADALRVVAEDTAMEDRRAERNGMAAVAVGKLCNDDVVAGQQGRLHRGRGDGEGLEQQDAQNQGDQQGVEDGFADFHP